jgi:hypothetical protein
MPWYISCAFAGYSLLLIWQVVFAIETGAKALVAVPFLVVKLCTLGVALSYWVPAACVVTRHLGMFAVFLAGSLTLQEALATLRPVLLNPEHPPEADNLVLALTILAAVVFPAMVFFFAARAVLTHVCGLGT